jgi:TonB-dependent receptor
MDFTFVYDLGDMPLSVNVGARYAQTDIDVSAVQSFLSDIIPTSDATLFGNVFGPATDIVEGGSYANLLPSVNMKLEVTDDMVVRFSVYDSLTRPTMDQLSPATTFNEPRRQNLTAAGGNPELKPFQSENWDMAFEYYYGDANLFTFAFFNKEVDNFITRLVGPETYTLSDRLNTPNNRCSVDNTPLCGSDATASADELNGVSEVYTVTRPQNGEAATVTGYEIGLTHLFDNGFGVQANVTVVDSDVSIGADVTQTFALEGIGDSQNLVLFYEKDGIQARIAYNNREGFLRAIDNGFNGEPINTDSFGQVDMSASYDINERFTVFLEGINITEEELVQFGRFDNQTYSIEDNGRRFSLGVRATF